MIGDVPVGQQRRRPRRYRRARQVVRADGSRQVPHDDGPSSDAKRAGREVTGVQPPRGEHAREEFGKAAPTGDGRRGEVRRGRAGDARHGEWADAERPLVHDGLRPARGWQNKLWVDENGQPQIRVEPRTRFGRSPHARDDRRFLRTQRPQRIWATHATGRPRCASPPTADVLEKLNFVDTTNGIKFTIDCLATARPSALSRSSLATAGAASRRRVEGGVRLRECRGRRHDGVARPSPQAPLYLESRIESDSIIGELKKIQAQGAPDAVDAALDARPGAPDRHLSGRPRLRGEHRRSGQEESRNLLDVRERLARLRNGRDVEQTSSTADVDRDDQEKTSISIDGDAGTTISTKLAEVTNSGETTSR